jgi:hypothetical protein
MGSFCLSLVVALAGFVALLLVLNGLGRLARFRIACLIFAVLAAAGLVLSAAVHFSTFAGVDPLDLAPWVWLLHIGIFVVFVPAIFLANRAKAGKRESLASQFPNAPRWMAWMTGLFFAYAFVNFAVFIFLMREGSPHQREDGTYALTDHGRTVREISAEEFHRRQGYVARGFSGHWMLFYSASLVALVSAVRTPPGGRREEGPTDGVLFPPERNDLPGDSSGEGA